MILKYKNKTDDNIARKTLIRVIVGIWICAAIVICAGVFFVNNKLSYISGELLGSVAASLLMLQLYKSIDVELDIDEAKARAHSRFFAMIRLVIEIALVVGCYFIRDYINPITVLIGLFGRKVGALLVPVIFDRERSGKMTTEDIEEYAKYGRLLTDKERSDMEISEDTTEL